MRKAALLLILILVCTVIPVNAFKLTDSIGDIYIYYGDEESMGTGRGDWTKLYQSEGTYLEKKDIDGETAFHFYGGEDGDKITTVLFLSQPKRKDADRFVVQFKMRFDNISYFENGTADAGPNPNWRFFSYLSVDDKGVMKSGGKNITTLQSGRFYELAFLTDNVTKSCKVYIDGNLSGSFTFDQNYNWLSEFSFSLLGKSGGSHMYIADLTIYEANDVKSYSEIEKAYKVKKETVSACPMIDELDAVAGNYTLFAAEAPYVYTSGKRTASKVQFIKDVKTLMAPIKYTAEIFGAGHAESGGTVSVTRKGNVYTFSENGHDNFDGKVIRKDGILYAEAEKFLPLFGNAYIGKEYPFAAVGSDNFENCFTDRVDEREMYYYLMYEKPSVSQILEDYQKTSANVHPRIYYTKEKIAKIKELAKTDADMKYWYEKQLSDAQKVYGIPVIELIKTENELNTSFSGDATCFSKLAFAYMVTKDKKWGDDLWRAIDGFINKNEDLNHRRAFLNGSEVGRQFALAYDWAFDYFTDTQKKKIENYLYTTTFEPWMRAHQGLTGYGSSGYAYKSKSNINCVLSAQIGVAALAVFDENPEFYSKLLCAIYRQMEYFLPCYAPDGGYYEGPSYWEYATNNLVSLFDATESTLGTLYGMYDVFNVKNTGEFPIYMNGDKLQFTLGDGYRLSLIGNLSVSYYFAMKNGDRAFAKAIIDLMREAGYPIGNRWYDPAFPSDEGISFSPDRYFRDIEAGSMRENWTGNSAYLAYHGGENSIGHGDLDIGTFIYDAYGKRWAEELGSDDYNYDQYFGTKRYLYYKKRGEGQNVLLINPSGKYEDQKKDAFSTLVSSASGEKGAYAVLDTSEAYGSDVTEAKRGFMLTDNRTQAVIRDEVTLTGSSELYWFMHTMAEKCEIRGDGKTAVLSIGRHKCIMELSSSERAEFKIMDAVHLPQSPKPTAQNITDLSQYKKIAVHIKGATGKVFINVNMKVTDVTEEKERPFFLDVPINQWDSVYDKSYDNPKFEESVFFTKEQDAMLYPVNGSTVVTAKTYISLMGAYIQNADIYVDGKLLESFLRPPFGKSVALSDGVHTIKAIYTDIYGRTYTAFSNITVDAKYNIIKERIFDFEDFSGYLSEGETSKTYKDSLILSGYGTASRHAYMHIANTDAGYGKSLVSETITGDMMGFGLTDWGDTWYESLYVEYDLLCSDFNNRRSEIYTVQCHGARLGPYEIRNGKLLKNGEEVFAFENNKWHKIQMLFDTVDRVISLYINGQCIADRVYDENHYGIMRPGYIVLGSYVPNSVMLVDNYIAVNLGRMPRVAVSGGEKEGFISKGEKRIKITSENFLQKASINNNTVSVTENGKDKAFTIEYGDATVKSGVEYVKEAVLVLFEPVKDKSEYTVTLKKGVNARVEHIETNLHTTFSDEKTFNIYSEGKIGLSGIKTEIIDGKIKYSFNTYNENGNVGKAVMVAAIYDDDSLVDFRIIRQSIPMGTSTITGYIPYSENGKTYKVFFTDMFDR